MGHGASRVEYTTYRNEVCAGNDVLVQLYLMCVHCAMRTECRLNDVFLLVCALCNADSTSACCSCAHVKHMIVLGEQAVRRLHDEGAHLVAMERAWLPLHLMMRARGRKANR